jgi:hypothetical protein
VTKVIIKDKFGTTHSGLQVGHAEVCGDGETDGQQFYPTVGLDLENFQRVLTRDKVFFRADAAVDYVVWQLTHGDNHQYTTLLYPGDVIILVSDKMLPVVGDAVKLFLDVETVEG